MYKELFQDIFDELQNYLPMEWEKVVLYVEYSVGSYSMKYYTKVNGTFVDCFNLQNVSKANLIKLFMNLDKKISVERNELEENNKWSVMTMIVDSEGGFTTDFDYSDLTENTIEYQRYWREKYIK